MYPNPTHFSVFPCLPSTLVAFLENKKIYKKERKRKIFYMTVFLASPSHGHL